MAHQGPLGPRATLAQHCKAPRVKEAMTVQRVEKESKDRRERKESKDCKGVEARGGRKEIKETMVLVGRWVTGDLRAYAETKALLARKVYKGPPDRRVITGIQAIRAGRVIKGRKESTERLGREEIQERGDQWDLKVHQASQAHQVRKVRLAREVGKDGKGLLAIQDQLKQTSSSFRILRYVREHI